MQLVIEGKTKFLTRLWDGADVASVTTKDDITAGDGAKHDILIGKSELATRTTCNVFEYLRSKGVPVAYIGRDGPTTFLTWIVDMISVEVVVRQIATGSYLKRNPAVAEGTMFNNPVVEFFYKTTGRRIGDQELPCDDPLMIWKAGSGRYDGEYDLHLPNQPISPESYTGVSIREAISLSRELEECRMIALEVNRHLLDAWVRLRGTLYDFKLEFGVLPGGRIVLADVVDCDSWRVKWNGIQLSKQGYREGDDLGRVLGVYRLAASLSDQFARG